MTEAAESEHDLATRMLIELYSEIPPPGKLVTGHFHNGGDYRVVRPDGVGSWYLLYTAGGTGHYQIGRDGITLRHGDLILVSPGTEHDYGTVGTYWENWWAHFQPRRDWHAWWSLPEAMPGLSYVRLTRPADTDRVVSAFTRLHRDAQRAGLSPTGDTELQLLEQNLAVQLTMNGIEEVLLVATSSLRRDNRQLDARVQLVLDAITSDPARPHTLNALAGLAQVSVSRLAHLFKAQVGDSIMNVVVGLRLQRAAELLTATDMSIGQVARAVGFESPHYFSRQFGRHFGLPPTTYRDSVRNPD
ncbi:AraC family transcriptional regulator of arabinose operon [Kribbella amoyensis]|uniref:AraC family transcriptional regulator of arabinose operon n=1 Tax=Kribbella amoyensis TaxID=996641 RepID=A0A561BJJ2_9ACTN|nr:helix-turn-helix domain-containing protein [Kribbella amoyensis]TWD79033.1 AraC family transcriptional regulator of arabinose operon [Kribbella amoyensis]